MKQSTYLRNFIFGVEDSLVSTVGLLAGVASASATKQTILVTGLVLIVVEGISMGIGSFLSEETTEEMTGKKLAGGEAVKGALIMFSSYCLAGFIPLFPYLIWSGNSAIYISVFLSLFGLGMLGFGTSLRYHRPQPLRRAIKMFALGGIAVLSGVMIGKIFHL